MLEKIKILYQKYAEIINYLIVGGLTTVVSLGTKYALLFTVLDAKNPLQLQISVVVSWIAAVAFAYITNRKYVFKSKDNNILHELTLFVSARIATLIMESVFMWFFITFLKLNSDFYVIIWTIVSQVLILIGNYILSKFFVFNEKKNNKKKLLNKENIFIIIMFALLTILCYIFPYTHDDWAWGSSIGLDRLNSLFYKYNGRWAGNLLVLLLTRNRLIRAITISVTLSLIVFIIHKTISCKNRYSKYIIIALMLLMPVNIIAQSIAWTAGFSNYVPPVLITLIIIYLNKNIFEKQEVNINNKLILPLFILGFCGSLFVEHMTIFNVILSLAIVGYNAIKNKKIIWANVAYGIGAIGGAILMFSNGAYHAIATAEDTYRTIEQSNIIIKALKTYFDSFCKLFIYNNTVLNIFISVICLILIYKYLKNNNNKIGKKIILFCISAVFIFFMSYTIFVKVAGNSNILIKESYNKYLQGISVIIYYISILLTIFLCIQDKNRKRRILFELISIIIISAPLLIVTPIGPRCFLPTYIFLTLFAVDTYDYLFDNTKMDSSYILKMFIIMVLLYLLSIYGQVYLIDRERIDYSKEHQNDTVIILPKLPYENYMQVPNPQTEVFYERFKLFYNINEKSELKFIPYSEWRKHGV